MSKMASKYFTYSEFNGNYYDSKGKKHIKKVAVPEVYRPNTQKLAKNLDVLREYLGVPIDVSSGYRDPGYNLALGNTPNSRHTLGQAADITARGKSPSEVHRAVEFLISEGRMEEGGLGAYATFTHYDVRGKRARW